MTKGNARTAKNPCSNTRVSITYRSVNDLKLDPKNPRSHRPRQIRQIARSIVEFGFLVPILIDASGKVIAGHGRLLAARQLGWREVPTIQLHHLSEAQARAFIIADNRLTEISEWDDALLATQLRELAALDLDFSLEVTRFDVGEIDLRIEQSSVTDDDDERANQIPEPSGDSPVTRTGDVWILNEHRVLCASALERNSYATLMGKDRAEMVFIDPPYNVAIDGNVSGLGVTRHREFAMASGEMSKEEFQQFLTKVFLLLAKYSTLSSLHFVCMDWRHLGEVLTAGEEVYNELINCCVWVKDNAGMGSFYRSQHEFVFVFKSQKGSHRKQRSARTVRPQSDERLELPLRQFVFSFERRRQFAGSSSDRQTCGPRGRCHHGLHRARWHSPG